MNQKAIEIDLSAFFDDERKFCRVLVDPEWKTVACLQARVQLLFDVDCVRFLSDGCFLPPKESIEIIKFCKDIKAFAPKDPLELRKRGKSKKLKYNDKSLEEHDQQETNVTEKKRKHKSLEKILSNLSPLTPLDEELDSTRTNPTPIVSTLSSDCEESVVKNQSAKDEILKIPTEAPSISSSTFLNESQSVEQKDYGHRFSKSLNLTNPFKRSKTNKSHIYFNETGEIVSPTIKVDKNPKRKQSEELKTTTIFRCPLGDVSNDTQMQKPRIFLLNPINRKIHTIDKDKVVIQENIVLPPIPLQALINKELRRNEFDEQLESNETCKEADQTDCLNESNSLNNTNVFGCATIVKTEEKKQETSNNINVAAISQNHKKQLKEVTNTGETSVMSVDCVDLSIDLDNDIGVQKRKSEKKENINDLSTSSESNKSSVSDIVEISEIIDLNETGNNSNSAVNNGGQHNKSLKDMRIHEILPFSTDLKQLPNTEDIIIFKLPYLNKKKILVNTDFIAGKVEYINKRTKSIKILIIDGCTELCDIPNKFICNTDDSQYDFKYLQLKLNDMCDLKLFSTS